MSRKEHKGQKFDLAYGVDRYSGAFVQLFQSPMDDQDGAFLNVDSHGVRLDEDHPELPTELTKVISGLKLAFCRYKEAHNDNPNLSVDHVLHVARAADQFDTFSEKEVYQVFGDNA